MPVYNLVNMSVRRSKNCIIGNTGIILFSRKLSELLNLKKNCVEFSHTGRRGWQIRINNSFGFPVKANKFNSRVLHAARLAHTILKSYNKTIKTYKTVSFEVDEKSFKIKRVL